MLTESLNVRQIPGQPRRRWFSSEHEDLIVWYSESDDIVGFQLCYDRRDSEHAITWLSSAGFSHNRIDDGDSFGPLTYKPIAVLAPDGVFDSEGMTRRFAQIARDIPGDISAFVSSKLAEYPRANVGN